ncbi:MAG: hypothetical protein DMG57_08840 [Acidobacteria bacterium]|nr:MAG: hypothetical protein DMG57_08840 [Acidobacteriota bacterium]
MITEARMKRFAPALLIALALHAQVYSPRVLVKDQIDSSDLSGLVRGIYAQAHASTPREKAEAVWRFFLTDGRFVKPGFWYHIAGWAYEEPQGEVLDPVKLLNSYGFGLCYHIAPLLEATWKAGGFEDARVWFLTGHTVAEVFYDGAYHYFDSDMMGYNAIGTGDPRRLPVASVHQIEQNGQIILSKLTGPRDVDRKSVEYPWYPADVREAAIDGLAELFTTTDDNRLFPFTRYSEGHSMEFTLRPGERMIRYFRPEEAALFYLPYKNTDKGWEEFPQEIDQYQIRTKDGPRCQKDGRYWSTGRIEYTPLLSDPHAYYSKAAGEAVFEVLSPYVMIDGKFSVELDREGSVAFETSTDGGKSWTTAGQITGKHLTASPHVDSHSAHGVLTSISGHYGYLLKVLTPDGAQINRLNITARFQVNPRTLPALAAGSNELVYSAGAAEQWRSVPVAPERIRSASAPSTRRQQFAQRADNIRYVAEQSQGFLAAVDTNPGYLVFEIGTRNGAPISGFDAGGRFLDIRNGEAPDKLTAEVRRTAYRSEVPPEHRKAWLEWALNPEGPYTVLWHYDPDLKWKDRAPIDRTLRWPEVFRQVRSLPRGTRQAYVRYRLEGIALDSLRLAVISPQEIKSPIVEVTHLWHEGAQARSHVERISEPWREHQYLVRTGKAAAVKNDALIFYCPPNRTR